MHRHINNLGYSLFLLGVILIYSYSTHVNKLIPSTSVWGVEIMKLVGLRFRSRSMRFRPINYVILDFDAI